MGIERMRRRGFFRGLMMRKPIRDDDVQFTERMGGHFDVTRLKNELDAQESRLRTMSEQVRSVEESPYGSGDYERYIEIRGFLRRYEMHVPPDYTKARSWPVVFNFHGGAARAGIARWNTGMDTMSDRKGCIVVYPDGTGIWGDRFLTWNAGLCCGYAVTCEVDDVSFVSTMLDDLGRYFRVDENRIYATGFSNGAMLTYRLASELSDRIAAIAPVSGGLCIETTGLKRPVSLMHFHGTDDQYYPYKGGIGPRSVTKTNYPSVQQSIDRWIALTGCARRAVHSVQERQVRIDTYRAEAGTEVVLVTIAGGGHSWPGGKPVLREEWGAPVCSEIAANDLMWGFFCRHPLNRNGKGNDAP